MEISRVDDDGIYLEFFFFENLVVGNAKLQQGLQIVFCSKKVLLRLMKSQIPVFLRLWQNPLLTHIFTLNLKLNSNFLPD
jgi:hypothetical protein